MIAIAFAIESFYEAIEIHPDGNPTTPIIMCLKLTISLQLTCLALAFTSIFSKATMSSAMYKDPHPMQIDDLFRLARVADPQLNPDGSRIVYQVTMVTDAAKNAKNTQLWLVELNKTPRQITYSGKADLHARWSPDGTKILFESNRDGVSQLYIMDLAGAGKRRSLRASRLALVAASGLRMGKK